MIANPNLRGMAGGLFSWKVAVLAAVVGACLFVYRPFCRFLCPLGALYSFFNRFALIRWTVDEGACTGCGTCVRVCPLNNVSIVDGTVQFGAACTACYACIHRCPTQALNIVGKTEDKGRYVCPRYEEWSTAQNAL